MLAMVAGCAAVPRNPAPAAFAGTGRPAGLPAEIRGSGLDEERFAALSPRVIERVRAAATDGTVDVLALSGGGAGGAFGAGALTGLTQRGTRPQFEIVTGVSAGALIAPFAFAGPAWDPQLTAALDGVGTGGILQRRTIDLFFRPSFYRGKPLAAFVNRVISDALIEKVAEEAGTGRLLLVATTELDSRSTIIWSMGAIARVRTAASRKLFREVLIASASIPGIFPPVLIRVETDRGPFDEMHVDGGATVPFFVAPEVASIVPGLFAGLPGANLYVVMNTQLGGLPDPVPGRLGPIMARSSSVALTYMSRKELQVAAALAQDHGMSFLLTEIPIDYPFGGPIDFEANKMRMLFDYGQRCAAQGHLWTTPAEALRRSRAAVAGAASRKERLSPENVPCPLDGNRP